MDEKFVLRVAKFKSGLQIQASGNHNFRVVVPENAEVDRGHLNENIGPTSTPAEMVKLIDDRVSTVKNVDKKATRLMEYVISASPDQFASNPDFDEKAYFADCMDWIKQRHGEENVVSAWIHRDEDTPHLHVHIVPIVTIEAHTRLRSVGKKGGGRENRPFEIPAETVLSANQQFGGPGKLSAMQTAFENQIGQFHGLARTKRFTGDSKGRKPYVSPREYRDRLEAKMREVEALKVAVEAKVQEVEALKGEWSAKVQGLDQRLAAVAGLEDREAAVKKERRTLEKVGPLLDVRETEVKAMEGTAKGMLVEAEQRLVAAKSLGEAVEAKQKKFLSDVVEPFKVRETAVKHIYEAHLDKTKGFSTDQIVAGIGRCEEDKVVKADPIKMGRK